MKIFAHRGNLDGKKIENENSVNALINALIYGFDLEFDINFDMKRQNMILSHDIQTFNKKYEPAALLSKIKSGYHALNIKSIYTVPSILWMLEEYNNKKNFFLFDFELIAKDIKECRFLMRSLIKKKFNIAFRLSERENFLNEYIKDTGIKDIWLDEFNENWVDQNIVKKLKDKGKTLFYVSPELHKDLPLDTLKKRWEKVMNWGVNGICTDFPIELNKFYGEKND